MHTHVHTYMHTPTHAEQPYNRFDRSLGFIKELREFSIAKRSTKRYTCVCVYVLNHIFHQLSCCSVAQSCLTLWSRGLKHSKLPCLSPSPGAYSNSSLFSQWCHSAILFSVIPFFSCLLSFPALGSFPMSRLFTSGGLSISNRLQFSSVAQSCPTFCNPMNCSTPGLPVTDSQRSLKLTSIESVMPSSHLTFCHPLLLLPSTFSSIRVFSNESALDIQWPKYSSFSISPSSEYSELISFGIDRLDLLAVQGTLKSLLQHHSSEASILQCSAFFMVQHFTG